MRVAVIWERFGPYHHARMAAAAKEFDLHGVEIVTKDETYAWEVTGAQDGYELHNLGGQPIAATLAKIVPDVVAVPGWEASFALDAIGWARANGCRIVLMSDSNWHDAPRSSLKEALKRGVVEHADAGFAAGTLARDYLAALGIAEEKTTLGYDVIDNDHFAPTGELPSERSGFLAVARFVEKKNLGALLKAFAKYRRQANGDCNLWDLTLVGDGPLAQSLRDEATELGVWESVHFQGFRQYPELPAIYHSCGAFVLPSTVEQWGLVVNEAMAAGLPVLVTRIAGSAPDLVKPGVNGFTFDPDKTEELTAAMVRIAHEPGLAASMGAQSREIIANWGPGAFVDGLRESCRHAVAGQPAKPSFFAHAALALLQYRQHVARR